MYCGEVTKEDGKQKKITIDIEPFKPISTKMYRCDNRFHCEDLTCLLESDDRFGFLIMDGNGALYGTLQGNHREVLHRFSVDLPPKHGRGGQSALRFARLRLEKRHMYVQKVAELCTKFFITSDVPNITGLVVAGSAEFKQELTTSALFDPRLEKVLIRPLIDVAYGGENGFNQAIELAVSEPQEREIHPREEVDHQLLGGDCPAHWQVLLRHQRHDECAQERCRFHSHRLGERGD